MQNETRVNLKHLLEDIRDAYSAPLEEVIIVELVANALDSKATQCDLTINTATCSMRFVDNGAGMKRVALREYHNIAASTKSRGEGIGFAGIGAKLSLLVATTVTTESKGGKGSRAASEWLLAPPYRAPWKFVPIQDVIPYPRGTAVTLQFTDQSTPLLQPAFLRETILHHFYPLIHPRIHEEILRYVYKKGIQFTVNGELITMHEGEDRVDHVFRVQLGKGKRPIGAGFLTKNVLNQGWFGKLVGVPEKARHLQNGLSVSTYGKVIKGGWEWLGINPAHPEALCGVVEVPALAELLTTNKSDFLTDAVHLRKYYRLRRAIQEAVIPVLRALGEYGADTPRQCIEKNMKPLTRDIEAALERVSDDFPELAPLLATRRGAGGAPAQNRERGANDAHRKDTGDRIGQVRDEHKKKRKRKDGEGEGTKKRPGLSLALAELTDMPHTLGRVVEETVTINTLHPAWKKALATKQEEYHIVLTTALALSEYLDPDKNPQQFLEKLLASWSQVGTQATLL